MGESVRRVLALDKVLRTTICAMGRAVTSPHRRAGGVTTAVDNAQRSVHACNHNARLT